MTVSAIAIEPLGEAHLAEAHGLSAAVPWPHRVEDWRLVLELGRGFAAVADGRLAGTIIWWPFGPHHATLGMVIVDPAMQGRGLGRRLMETALADAGTRTVLLNATAEGLPSHGRLVVKNIVSGNVSVRRSSVAAKPAREARPYSAEVSEWALRGIDAAAHHHHFSQDCCGIQALSPIV